MQSFFVYAGSDRRGKLRAPICAVITLMLAVAGQAAPISYGTFEGDHVFFQNVTEDSATDTVPLFYGAPFVLADAMVFSPVSFSTASTGANGVDITDGTLHTIIQAKPGFSIDMISISEAGDYTMSGPGTAGTFAGVGGSVSITVLEVDHQDITPIRVAENITFTPSDGDFNIVDDGPAIARIWNGQFLIQMAVVLAANQVSGNVTKASVTIDNTLVTLSETGTSSSIQKTDGSLVIGIPEPASHLLLLAGLAAITRRRRSSRTPETP